MKGLEDAAAGTRIETMKSRILTVMEDLKALEVAAIPVGDKTSVADWFLVCTGQSDTHCRAIAENITLKLKADGYMPANPVDWRSKAWVLIDYGDVIVHILSREARQSYRLETLWDPAATAAAAAAPVAATPRPGTGRGAKGPGGASGPTRPRGRSGTPVRAKSPSRAPRR